MLEAQIEAAAVKAAKANGWEAYKFMSPQRRSVPDRLFVREGRVVFIEFKRPGGKLTSGQEREIEKLRRHGAEVWVCYSKQEVAEVLNFGVKMGLYPEKP
jgi:hypothetical protein